MPDLRNDALYDLIALEDAAQLLARAIGVAKVRRAEQILSKNEERVPLTADDVGYYGDLLREALNK